MNNPKKQSTENGSLFLQNSFAREQGVLRENLQFSSTSVTHSGVMGDVTEGHFVDFLRRYLPKRYSVDNAIVIDSNGVTSDHIDIVIFDNQYTPTLLAQKNHRYVTAEAVYAVIEVKPTINKKYLDYAGAKAESVRILERTSTPIVHAGGEYDPKPLFPIMAGIVAADVDWVNGFASPAFIENHSSLVGNHALDFGLALSGGCFDTYSGDLQPGVETNSMAYFLFRLLEKLNSLGTVPSVDWTKYALAFSENFEDGELQ